jgi:hypothetical protein
MLARRIQPLAGHGESSPWFAPSSDLGAPPDWMAMAPDVLSAARKRLADAMAGHDHARGTGCDDLRDAYDALARVRAPMVLPDPLPTGTDPWNRP